RDGIPFASPNHHRLGRDAVRAHGARPGAAATLVRGVFAVVGGVHAGGGGPRFLDSPAQIDHPHAGHPLRSLDGLLLRPRIRDRDAALPLGQALASGSGSPDAHPRAGLPEARAGAAARRAPSPRPGAGLSRGLQFTIGLVISGVCLWLAMHDVRPAPVLAALGPANYLALAAPIVATLLGFGIRPFRWRWLLTTPEPLPIDPLYSATMIGFMANNLLPLRLGEFVRAWALGRRVGLAKTTVFATVVVERVVDMIALIAIFGITMLVHPIGEGTDAGRLVRRGATLMVIGAAALTLFAILLERQPEEARGLVSWVTSPLPERLRRRLAAMLDHFVDGLAL